MPVPFDLTSTRARSRCIAGSTLTEGMVGGRLGGRQGGGPLGHLIGRQSFLIGSQKIYRNERRWRIVMTWPRAREVDLERDICECMGVYVSIHRRPEFTCIGVRRKVATRWNYYSQPWLSRAWKLRARSAKTIHREICRSLLRRSKDCKVRDRLRR